MSNVPTMIERLPGVLIWVNSGFKRANNMTSNITVSVSIFHAFGIVPVVIITDGVN